MSVLPNKTFDALRDTLDCGFGRPYSPAEAPQ